MYVCVTVFGHIAVDKGKAVAGGLLSKIHVWFLRGFKEERGRSSAVVVGGTVL